MRTHAPRNRWWTAALAALAVGATTTTAIGAPHLDGRRSAPGLQVAPPTPHHVAVAAARPPIIPLPAPGQFRRHVTNPYLPLKPGTRWVYRGYGSEGPDRDVVRVLHRTKRILGIRATVVQDRVTDGKTLIENTFDWYAQDRHGNVWYLGENTHAYDHGQVSTQGSWEAGVSGAHAGIAVPGRPRVGVRYWQEFSGGVAEDQGQVLDRSTRVAVAAGNYRHVLMTEDTSPLEPDVTEFKFYKRGVGTVLELDVSPAQGRVELVRMHKP